MVVKRAKASINYKIGKDHPDRVRDAEWAEDKVYNFSDTYYFKHGAFEDEAREYIKNDLMLIAGGGYDTKHISVVSIQIDCYG